MIVFVQYCFYVWDLNVNETGMETWFLHEFLLNFWLGRRFQIFTQFIRTIYRWNWEGTWVILAKNNVQLKKNSAKIQRQFNSRQKYFKQKHVLVKIFSNQSFFQSQIFFSVKNILAKKKFQLKGFSSQFYITTFLRT